MKSKREVAEEWLKFTVQNWKDNVQRMRIRHTGELLGSFNSNVVELAGGDRLKIEISYAWYGMMVDMGVGKGTRSGEQKEQAVERRLLGKSRGNRRMAKKWYSKGRNGMSYQMMRLSQILGEQVGTTAIEKIKGSIDHKQVITI